MIDASIEAPVRSLRPFIRALGVAPPSEGSVTSVADGVLWIRLSLPFAINHINVWALEDADGWTLIDTGAYTDATQTAWTRLIAGPLGGQRVTRVFATHMHSDHVGMAGWLVDSHRCELWMTRLEYLTCRVMVGDTGRQAPEAGVRFYRSAGWDRPALEAYKEQFGRFGRRIYTLPDSYRRVRDEESLVIGKYTWEVVTGSGHSPEHACLYCRDLRVLISGDQVLPRISSNVSVTATEPAADPLSEWLDSLDKIQQRIPDDVLVLPAHDEPFYGLHARIEELKERHFASLQRLRDSLGAPTRATDIFPVLFRRPITDKTRHMATGEALAHLNYLLHRNDIIARQDAEGVTWYDSNKQ